MITEQTYPSANTLGGCSPSSLVTMWHPNSRSVPGSMSRPRRHSCSSATVPSSHFQHLAPLIEGELVEYSMDLNIPTGVGNNNNTLVDSPNGNGADQAAPIRPRSGSAGLKSLLKFRKPKGSPSSESQKVPGGSNSASASRDTTPRGSPPDTHPGSSSKGLKGFLDSFRPRSKSDASAARANMLQRRRNVSGGAAHNNGAGGNALSPIHSPEPGPDYLTGHRERAVTWNARDRVQMTRDIAASLGARGAGMRQPVLDRSSSVGGQRGDLSSKVFIYREPSAVPADRGNNSLDVGQFDKIKIEQIGEDDPLVYAKCMKAHTCYDAMPNSAKLLVFDTNLSVKKAFFALVYNFVRAAPLWDTTAQSYVGMLTISDFIYILQKYYKSPQGNMDELENHKISTWRAELSSKYGKRGMVHTQPEVSVFHAVKMLLAHKIHRLPIVEGDTGDPLTVLTLKRVLKFIHTSMSISQLPQPSYMNESIERLGLGTYEGLRTVRGSTRLVDALKIFVDTNVSALPVVDDRMVVEDIYSKFDVINLAADKTYTNLDIPVSQAVSYRRGGQERVYSCKRKDTLGMVIAKLVSLEIHRLVIVNDDRQLVGIISLSDIFAFLIQDVHRDYENDEGDEAPMSNGDEMFAVDP